MFRGSSFHTIDAKGRIIIPTRFREVINEDGENRLILSKLDGCLYGYTPVQWSKIEEKVISLAEKSRSMRRFRTVFIGGAFEFTPDKQSRILIPPILREYADLLKEIVLVGVLDHFEIWSAEHWIQENEQMEQDMAIESVRNEIGSLGL